MATDTQDRVVAKLQALVRVPTVSDRDPALVDTAAFDRLLKELADQFPRLHAELELTRVGTHGLLFRWPGDSAEMPVVLMAHLDVVPIDEDAPWQHPPFGAEIHDGTSGAAAPSTTRVAWWRSAKRSSCSWRPGTRPLRTCGCPSVATRK
ncbi:hypothetical protein [Nocardioides sp.]|uniref:hypothetical protein n=1 Tax=Nocardioides sp. TaxID=35761 RepID=UPI00286E1C10|nr:hypothetical protein [Nocardioides sp.]